MMNTYFDAALWQIIANQRRMLSMLADIQSVLTQVKKQETAMAITLDAITAEVAQNTSVTNSVVQLVQNLADQIANIPPSSDPVTQAALDALTATLTQNDTAIANTVTANTKPSTQASAARQPGQQGA